MRHHTLLSHLTISLAFCLCLLSCSSDKDTSSGTVDLLPLYRGFEVGMNLGDLQGNGYLAHRWKTWNTFIEQCGLSDDALFGARINKAIDTQPFDALLDKYPAFAPFLGTANYRIYAEEKADPAQRNLLNPRKAGKALLNPFLLISDEILGANRRFFDPVFRPASELRYDGSVPTSITYQRKDGLPTIMVEERYVPFMLVFADANAHLVGTHAMLEADPSLESGPAIASLPEDSAAASSFIYRQELGLNQFYFEVQEDRLGGYSRFDDQLVGAKVELTNWWHDNHNLSDRTAFFVRPKERIGGECKPGEFCSETHEIGWTESQPKRRLALPRVSFAIYNSDKLVARIVYTYQAFWTPAR